MKEEDQEINPKDENASIQALKKPPKWKWWLRRTFAFIFLIITLLGSGIYALRFPMVQTWIVQKAIKELSKALHYPIYLSYLSLNWFDTIELRGVIIKDRFNDKMIYVEKLIVKFSLVDLLKGKFYISEAEVFGADVQLTLHKESEELNINEFIRAVSGPDTTKSDKPFSYDIGPIELKNARFTYFDEHQKPINQAFDYYHFTFNKINTQLDGLKFREDSVFIGIERLACIEQKSGLRLNNVTTDFLTCNTEMRFDDLDLKTQNSHIKKSIVFNFESYRHMGNFIQEVRVKALIDNSTLDVTELSYFAPQVSAYKDQLFIDGNFEGTVEDFVARDFSLGFGRSSYIKGSGAIVGLPEYKESMIDLHIHNSKVFSADLSQYLDSISKGIVQKAQWGEVTGEFKGEFSKFRANATLSTPIGKAISNLDLDLTGGYSAATYDGSLQLEGAQLGLLADDKRIGDVSMNGSIVGTGLTIASANFKLDADFSGISFNGYRYKGIYTEATLSKRFFNGILSVVDSNLTAEMGGSFQIPEKGISDFDLELNISKSHPDVLGWDPQWQELSGVIDADFSGLDLDEIEGNADVKQIHLKYGGRMFDASDLRISAHTDSASGIKRFSLNSDVASAMVKGKFTFERLGNHLFRTAEQLKLLAIGKIKESEEWYKKNPIKAKDREAMDLRLEGKLHRPEAISNLLFPDVRMAENTRFLLTINSDSLVNVEATVKSDSLRIGNSAFYGIKGHLTSEIFKSKEEATGNLVISSQRQKIAGVQGTEAMRLDAMLNNRELDFSSFIKVPDSQDYAELNGIATRNDSGVVIQLGRTALSLMDKFWRVDPKNQILIQTDGRIKVEHLKISEREQVFEVKGIASASTEDTLNVIAKSFGLETIGQIIQQPLKGKLDAEVGISSVFDKANFWGTLNGDSLKVGKAFLGHAYGTAEFQPANEAINLNLQLDRDNRSLFKLFGRVFPSQKEDNLFLKAYLDRTNLSVLETFLGQFVTDWGGDATGVVRCLGSFADPKIEGSLYVDRGQFRYKYINTLYKFSDTVKVTEKSIDFSGVTLRDEAGKTAEVKKGIITHKAFDDIAIGFDAKVKDFELLNTSNKDNSLYYGKAVASGDIKINGPLDNLDISALIKSESGTSVTIPISDESDEASENNFIVFKDSRKVKQSVDLDSLKGKVRFTGIKMNFHMELTPAADIHLLMDKKTGENIKGSGSGIIDLNIDTQGEFTMNGNYTFNRGQYHWFFGKLVDKKFNILNGSTVAWAGDPLAAQLNIKAEHTVRTSLAPIIPLSDSSVSNSPEGRRMYPVKVTLGLTGEMLKPTISYDLGITDYPNTLNRYVVPFEANLRANDAALSNQVFSLFLTNGLQSTDPLRAATGTSSTQYLSSYLTSQLNQYLQQLNENVELGIDINSGMVNFAYSAFDKRVRISRVGYLGNQAASSNPTAQAIGDWSLDYVFTPEGNYVLKAFTRNNINTLGQGFQSAGNPTTTGVSVVHTSTFNSFSDLFKRKKKATK